MHRMVRIAIVAIITITATTLALCSPALAVDADDEEQNCAAFTTQAEAQAWFTAHGGSKTNNPDFLDADHDGIACEHLGSAPGSATTTSSKDDGGFPWLGVILGVVGVAVLGGIGGALATIVRKRQAAAPVGTTPFVAMPAAMPDAVPTEIPCDPPPPGWPTVSEARDDELAGMPDAAYRATPEWQHRADAILLATGGRCQLCNDDLMLPDQVRHRTTDRRGRELPCDLIVLCDRCAAHLGLASNEE